MNRKLLETRLLIALLAAGLLLCLNPQLGWCQDGYERLYAPSTIQKYKVRRMTVEFFATPSGIDTSFWVERNPDFRERYTFDSEGRPSFYEATDINIQELGTPGPHLISTYEYGLNGSVCHRHDTTVFGSTGEWHFRKDSTGRPKGDELFHTGSESPTSQRSYFYDFRGRMEKMRTVHSNTEEGKTEDCAWVFFINDNQSFNATGLAPTEMARCKCSLEYLDDQKRPVRRIVYDSTGAIDEGVILSYDRTGKPIKLQMLDQMGKKVESFAEISYGRNGIVKVQISGSGSLYDAKLNKLVVMSRAFVLGNWATWRLLREIRVSQDTQEFARYVFSYEMNE